MTTPWTERCPEGHASVRRLDGAGYRCEACNKRYEGAPVNVRNVEEWSEVEAKEMPMSEHHLSVLLEIIRRVEPDTRTSVKPKELGNINRVPSAIPHLQQYGYIECATETSRGNWWRPTEKGRRAVKTMLEVGDA